MAYIPLIKKISDAQSTPLQKYQDLFVGSRSIADLIKYEIGIAFLSVLPGGLGIYLRSKAYRRLLSGCGRNVLFGRGVTIRAPNQIRLGSNVIVDDNAVLDAKGDPERSWLVCGNEVEIGRNSILACKNGAIAIGDFVSIGRNVLLSSISQLKIGSNTTIGPFACILASGHDWRDPDVSVLQQNREVKEIVIEDNVWIGAHVTVLDGVHIGKGCVVGACSLVNGDLPPYTVAYGVPAKAVKSRRLDVTCAPSSDSGGMVRPGQ